MLLYNPFTLLYNKGVGKKQTIRKEKEMKELPDLEWSPLHCSTTNTTTRCVDFYKGSFENVNLTDFNDYCCPRSIGYPGGGASNEGSQSDIYVHTTEDWDYVLLKFNDLPAGAEHLLFRCPRTEELQNDLS